jgi:hypothetical protein
MTELQNLIKAVRAEADLLALTKPMTRAEFKTMKDKLQGFFFLPLKKAKDREVSLVVRSTWPCSLESSITEPRGILYSSLN